MLCYSELRGCKTHSPYLLQHMSVPHRQGNLGWVPIFWDTIKKEKVENFKENRCNAAAINCHNCSGPVTFRFESGAEKLDVVTWTFLTVDRPLTTQQAALGSMLVLWWKWSRHLMAEKFSQLGILRLKFAVTSTVLFGFETRRCVQQK